jgi:hypothetical protein
MMFERQCADFKFLWQVVDLMDIEFFIVSVIVTPAYQKMLVECSQSRPARQSVPALKIHGTPVQSRLTGHAASAAG